MQDGEYLSLTQLACNLPGIFHIEVARNGLSGFAGKVIDDRDDSTIAFIRSYVAKNDDGKIVYGITVDPDRSKSWATIEALRASVPQHAWGR